MVPPPPAARPLSRLVCTRVVLQELTALLASALDAAGGPGAVGNSDVAGLVAQGQALHARVAELAAREKEVAQLHQQGLARVKSEASGAEATAERVAQLEQEQAAAQEELRQLRATRATAERHLDVYERMVVKLEAKVERLQAEGHVGPASFPAFA